ncbi:MAG TPA: 2OG-Fe(II) oxygenase [Polyangiaceae bacterium]|nr:2OG-Fe(II) oxygenase [Polyangiaceae bacterium]
MAASDSWFLERKPLKALALARRAAYSSASPYPHAVFDGFLGEARALDLASRFPGPAHPGWLRRDYAEQSARLGQLQRVGFEGVDPALRHLLAELSAMAFLDFLGALTGIEGLIPDPHFRGAGLSLTLPGGHLALHADFNRDRTRHLQRKVTVLYYLSGDWQPEWGGALELWDEARTICQACYPPLLDRLIVMAHGDTFWHGHPAPLGCPEGRFRAALSAYYYVAPPSPDEDDSHGAIWATQSTVADG